MFIKVKNYLAPKLTGEYFRVQVRDLPVNYVLPIDRWKYSHYILACIKKMGIVFFLFSLGLNLAYIEYSLYLILNVYMQYSRCYDHSNKYLFLVIQQTEVLLNIFGECKWCTYGIVSYERAITCSRIVNPIHVQWNCIVRRCLPRFEEHVHQFFHDFVI